MAPHFFSRKLLNSCVILLNKDSADFRDFLFSFCLRKKLTREKRGKKVKKSYEKIEKHGEKAPGYMIRCQASIGTDIFELF